MIQRAAVFMGAVFAAFGIACGEGDGGGPLEIVANRTSGVAPLLVVFEGDLHPGQRSSAPFHELDYVWDFGDSGSGDWDTSGQSKDEDFGPVAAHVFEDPGTYRVRLQVRNAAGELTSGEVQITVEDPDDVFPGESTVCFSGAGDFAGCPSGALQITTSSMGTVMSHEESGMRLLLHRGESFSGNSSAINSAGPGIVGAYGTGNAPVVALTGSAAKGFKIGSGSSGRMQDWRIMDLEIDGSGASSSNAIEAGGRVRDILLYRLAIHDVDNAFELSMSLINFQNSEPHEGVGIVECTASSFTSNLNGAFISGVHFAVLGSDIDLGAKGEHTMRVDMMRASVIAHSILSHPATSKHCLKLHAPEWTGNGDTDYSERVVIRQNTFVGQNNDWVVAIGPQNDTSNEHVRDVLVEANHFVAGSGSQVGLVLMGEAMSARNNVFDMSAGFGRKCISVSRRGVGPSPRDVAILHNTCYTSAEDATMVNGAGNWPNVAIGNNLIVAPGQASVGTSADAETIVEGNLGTSDAGFATEPPSAPLDFRLAGGSPAENAGAPLPIFMRDYEGIVRPSGSAPDVGAFERH